jgi:hypothetical protein
MADFLTFENLFDKVARAIKDPQLSKKELIKDIINMVYQDEVMVCDDLHPLYWLVDFDDSMASVGPATITGITQADPGVITTDAAHGLAVGDIVGIYNIVGMTEFNNRILKVATAPSTTTLTLIDLDDVDAIDTTGYTAWSSAGTVHHRGKTLATTGKAVQRVLAAKWHDEKSMDPIGYNQIEEQNSWVSDSTARPERYMQRKSYSTAGVELNQMLWYQGANDAYDLRYWFERRVSPLVGDATVPQLPPQFHNAISAGSIGRLAEYSIEVEQPILWAPLYGEMLGHIRSFNRKHWDQIADQEGRKPFMI